MDDEEPEIGKLELERKRATAAEHLLSDPLIVEAFDYLENTILSEWKICGDPIRRDRLWVEQLLLAQVKGHLKTVIQTGKLAVQQLGLIQQRRRLVDVFKR